MMDDTKRADSARAHDDHEVISEAERAPGHGGASGGNLQRDVSSRAEEEHEVGGDTGVTRVRASDKKEEANLPRFNDR
ncbi:hypothetical protein [Sphingosinicella sp. CPCC 101087]|uniref:hypothetical protein n=1 Tax=Sphingosinicella sp. CPCC 101087 TaxID=2497754 RepID=UPI00101CFAD5|nr:hypothetical protein [Sphingosinicella sp. CPCC 101087]